MVLRVNLCFSPGDLLNFIIPGCGSSSITSGDSTTCTISTTLNDWEGGSLTTGNKKKIKLAIIYTKNGVQTATTPGTIQLTVV